MEKQNNYVNYSILFMYLIVLCQQNSHYETSRIHPRP